MVTFIAGWLGDGAPCRTDVDVGAAVVVGDVGKSAGTGARSGTSDVLEYSVVIVRGLDEVDRVPLVASGRVGCGRGVSEVRAGFQITTSDTRGRLPSMDVILLGGMT